jgi:hypothetical protein
MTGYHGVETFRVLTRKSFEALYENKFGFVEAHLGISEYHVWGATSESSVPILQIMIDLDQATNFSSDGDVGGAVFTDEFAYRLQKCLDIFFTKNNDRKFKDNSIIVPKLRGLADFPWFVPRSIVVTMGWKENGKQTFFALVENRGDWEATKSKHGIRLGAGHLYHCVSKFAEFSAHLKENFNKQGQFIGQGGPIKIRGYEPKN